MIQCARDLGAKDAALLPLQHSSTALVQEASGEQSRVVLAHLRNLSNEEKHRVTQLFLMLPTQISFGPLKFAASKQEVLGQRVKSPIYDFIGTEDPIYLGMPVLSIQLDAEPDVIERAGSVIPHIAMPGNQPMLESIERLLTFVHMILSDCARDLP